VRLGLQPLYMYGDLEPGAPVQRLRQPLMMSHPWLEHHAQVS
jgi:hypothetical protein